MDSILNLLLKRLENLKSRATELLNDYSSMVPVNDPDSSVVFIGPSNFWNELPSEGKALQVKILPDFDKFDELTMTLTKSLPSSATKEMGRELKEVRKLIDQHGTTWKDTPQDAVQALNDSCNTIEKLLSQYFGQGKSGVFAIPDTNALIASPNLEKWQFDGIKLFTLLLTPTVLAEIDLLKVNHKSEEVRKKAKALANKFFDYASRGDLAAGLTMVNNKILVKCIATEPKMAESLRWLEPTNADDRFLASTIEIMRENLSATYFIVTDDINMLNKANFASIPWRRTPETETIIG
jgi:hypothetical protein